MKGLFQSLVLPLLACRLSIVSAILGHDGFRPIMPRLQILNVELQATDLTGNTTFRQLIDHKNPGLGTFSQRVWWNATFWGGPGSPVVLFNPGEGDAAPYVGYLTDRAITGAHAKAIKAAIVMVEHRDYGVSAASKVQDTRSLQYLTLENAVKDMVNLARNLKLPFDEGSSSNAPQAPWVFVGGSYTGALAAWIQRISPDTFWAYHASSAPVQAIYDYWQYFVPIQQGMPKNCSRDFERITTYIDNTLTNGTDEDIKGLKEMFGLEKLTHHDDFASAILSPLGRWQAQTVTTGYGMFHQMCDSIEGLGYDSPYMQFEARDDGIGEWEALNNFANWYQTVYGARFCSSYDYPEWQARGSVGCFDSYNVSNPFYTDWSPANTAPRAWLWQLCNEPLFYWQTGTAPAGRPTIVSKFVTPEYYQRQCDLFFPKQDGLTFGSNSGRTANQLNALTGGWNLTNTTRLLWINGQYDPWITASVSSEFRPGGPLKSTPEAPVFVILGATHCQDMQLRNNVNAAVKTVQEAAVKQIAAWVGDFYKLKEKPKPAGGDGVTTEKRWWDARSQ